MLISASKMYFPLLPFEHEIPYFYFNSNDDSSNETLCNEIIEIDLTKCENNTYDMKTPIKKKSPVKLNETAENFKFSFYKIFTMRKKFPKKYVVMIHNEICNKLNMRKITREESRSIDLYFANFATASDKILIYIRNNINTIINNIPELRNIMN